MEAMALRRPILTTFIAGIPELVIHRENGWLFPAGAVEELEAAMEECLTMPVSDLERMGEQAHNRVLQRHDIDIEATKLAVLFRKTIRSESISV
jgi:colanic acid/amylovoran biosynthesis glycosyltransferase